MLGKCGFILSIIEQIGFMKRYYNTYCKDNNIKCLSKLIKYEFRLVHAIKEIKLLYMSKRKTMKKIKKIKKKKTVKKKN